MAPRAIVRDLCAKERRAVRYDSGQSVVQHAPGNPNLHGEYMSMDESIDRYSILFVDDDISVLKALKRLLRDEDYDVHTATNYRETMSLLASRTFAVAISDFKMPGITGDDLLGVIKSCCPATIRVMLSGTTDSRSVPAEIADGILNCQLFLSKPWGDAELVDTIRKCIDRYKATRESLSNS